MSYTERDFRTKKALRDAVKRGDEVRVLDDCTGPVGDGVNYIEGPHPITQRRNRHSWYVRAKVQNSVIIEVLP